MKNTLFILLLIPLFAFSQVSMEKVLIEMGTATWNAPCAWEVDILEQLQEDGLDICIINYHLNDPFANDYANDRAFYYNIQSVPTPIVNGSFIDYGNYDQYLEAYNEAITQPSYFTISVDGYFLEDSLFLEAEITRVADYESDSISLHFAITESSINYNWQGLTVVQNVERCMAPNAQGSDLNFPSWNILNVEEKFVFDRNWNPANMELVAFIQNDTTHEILQCHSIPLTLFSPLPVHAFFQVNDTMNCKDDQIQFQNYATGDVENIQWYFEGGTPEESNEEEPIISYHNVGDFDVKLIVSNAISTDTNEIVDYIHIQELPIISFATLPVFCFDQDPYRLIEGYPPGGHYFGLFVDTGYFHPTTAGIGEHAIYFSYQNPGTTCSDTLSQIALVDLCDGIDANIHDLSFPFNINNLANRLYLSGLTSLSSSSYDLFIYDSSGKQIISAQQKTSDQLEFYIHSYNSYLILHVLQNEKEYMMKYQMK